MGLVPPTAPVTPKQPPMRSALRDKLPPPEVKLDPVPPASKLDCIAAIVIPARMECSRLSHKPMLSQSGEPLIYYTIRNALKAERACDVGVVTPDAVISKAVLEAFRGKLLCALSHKDAQCGSQRISYWLDKQEGWDTYDVVVNLQCDEPTIDPRDLDNLIAACKVSEEVCTLVTQFESVEQQKDNSAVKAWMRGNKIRDFSRSLLSTYPAGTLRLHVGAYAMPRKWFKSCFADRMSPRAKSMSLEQLTWLDGGLKINGVELRHTEKAISVNTQRDYDRFCEWVKAKEHVA